MATLDHPLTGYGSDEVIEQAPSWCAVIVHQNDSEPTGRDVASLLSLQSLAENSIIAGQFVDSLDDAVESNEVAAWGLLAACGGLGIVPAPKEG